MEKEIKTRSFVKWELYELEKRFGLKQVNNLSELTDWLAERIEPKPDEFALLKEFRPLWAVQIESWNGAELLLKLVSLLLILVNFTTDSFRFFADREISAGVPVRMPSPSAENEIIEKVELKGVTDWFVAAGRQTPKAPYFCFQEHKRVLEPSGDPRPQLLAAMLVAQTQNINPILPIYGAYTVGRQWFFVVLQKREYAVSHGYDPTREDDLPELFRILLALKARLLRRFE